MSQPGPRNERPHGKHRNAEKHQAGKADHAGPGRRTKPGPNDEHETPKVGHETVAGPDADGRHCNPNKSEGTCPNQPGHGEHDTPVHSPLLDGLQYLTEAREKRQQEQGEEGQQERTEYCQNLEQCRDHCAKDIPVVHIKAGESIQAALEKVKPGTTIMLAPGVYNESFKSRCDGLRDKPITVQGPKVGSPAIVKGDDKSGTCVEINHDYYILDGFTIDGQIHECSNKDDAKAAFREKCLAIRGKRNPREITAPNGDRYPSAVEGCVVRNMKISSSGGEGIRLRYFVTHTKIYHNKIMFTGCYQFKFGGDQGNKNGEGIYIGTSSTQWTKNLTCEPDVCRGNHVYENYIDTHGNECVDVKEGTLDAIIESNYCTGQLDKESAGIDSRADKTIIRYNKVENCKGAGVRLGGHKVGNVQYGIHCQVYCNKLVNNEFSGVKVMTQPNEIYHNNISGEGKKYKLFRGDGADKFEKESECSFDVKPPRCDIEENDWLQKLKNM